MTNIHYAAIVATVFIVSGNSVASAAPAQNRPAQNRAAQNRPAQNRPEGPCDIYAAAGTPCVTAHSTVRALLAAYHGPLYQVKRPSDGKLLDIQVNEDGTADAAAQDRFCANTLCVINLIYDQSGKGNHLRQAPPGPLYPGPDKGAFDAQPIADMAPITIRGHKAYGVFIMPGMGFRNNDARDLPINDEPAGIHVVLDGTHFDSGCCFNYGNASTNGRAVGTGTMESVYFGISTGWGSGAGKGPWIMSDMEAGLFSGYNARVNEADPSLNFRFVTGMFGGGGRNFWSLKGGNAQAGGLSTFYSGVRPGSRENSAYFPMHKQGAIQMGNGGDNGNGSAGTFYEGVMTAGHPGDAATDAVQANIVAAKYDVPRLELSRLTGFTPSTVKELTVHFTNTGGAAARDVRLRVSLPAGWSAKAVTPARFVAVAPGASVQAAFLVTSPAAASAGFLAARAVWQGGADTMQQSVRSAAPVKINELRFASGGNAGDQFVELYNAAPDAVDISHWTLTSTPTMFAPVRLADIPAGTRLAPHGFYLLGLSQSGLAAPTTRGAGTILVRSTAGFTAGQQIVVEGERRGITGVGTAAAAPTTIFIPVSTGQRLTFAAGATSLPVASAEGFTVGQKIGIDLGGRYEQASVTAVGKAATQTTLTVPAASGAVSLRVAASADISVGDTITIGTGQRRETAKVAGLGAEPGAVALALPLKFDHAAGIDVWGAGTGIRFAPATRFAHASGDAVQALGSGIILDRPLDGAHAYGAPVAGTQAALAGYQGPAPSLWFGNPFSIRGGSLALKDARGKVVVDAIVFGSQQSNSSASGTVTSPELATLAGVQSGGGCIAIIPGAASGPGAAAAAAAAAAPGAPNRSIGRFPDGRDTASLCSDFVVQPSTSLAEGAAQGAANIKVASVADFAAGQTVMIDTGANMESATVAAVGTAGATRIGTAIAAGVSVIPVAAAGGFAPGQTVTIDSAANMETATVAAAGGGRGGARLTVTVPLAKAHAAGAPVSGSGITLSRALNKAHAGGALVTTDLPTPGAANKYSRVP